MRATPGTSGFAAIFAGLLISTTAAARSLTLEEALALADENSPSVAQSRARLEEAEADAATARAALFPKLFGNASYSWLDPNRLSPMPPGGSATPALYAQEGYAGLRAKQVLFDGLKSWAWLSSARLGVDAEQSGALAARLDARLLVTQSFVRLLGAQRLVDVAAQSVDRQRAFEALIAEQLALGRGARLDLLKAQAQRLEAERTLVAAREARNSASAALRRWIGLEAPEELVAHGELVGPGAEPEGASLRERVRAANPDLRRVEAQILQAGASANAARGTYLPELSLQGAYGYRHRDVGGGADEWTAGVALDWTLFDGLANRAQVARSEARGAQLREARRALELQIEADLQDALAAVRTAAAGASSTAMSVEVSQEAAAAAQALFALGRATSLDVLTSQADLARAEANHVVALGEHRIAVARLARLAGK